ncbi:MAG: hypothetical protein KAR06_01235 [Deltaproteobacteria bacterium]|nr:hypothetical protein [Deltaproteobacteria bacterium]
MTDVRLLVEKDFFHNTQVKVDEVLVVSEDIYMAEIEKGAHKGTGQPLSALLNHCRPIEASLEVLEAYCELLQSDKGKNKEQGQDPHEKTLKLLERMQKGIKRESGQGAGDAAKEEAAKLKLLKAKAKDLKVRGYGKMDADTLEKAIAEAKKE